MLRTVARAVSRHPWPVVVVWSIATAVLLVVAPPLREVATQDNAAFLSEDAPSVVGGRVLARIWPEDEVGNTGALVFRRPGGLTEGGEGFIQATETWLRSDAAPAVVRLTQSPFSRPELRDVLLSAHGTTAILVIGFSTPPSSRRRTRRSSPSGAAWPTVPQRGWRST